MILKMQEHAKASKSILTGGRNQTVSELFFHASCITVNRGNRCFCGPDGAHPILLTNKNGPLIYSTTTCKQNTKDCAPSGSSHHIMQHLTTVVFIFQYCILIIKLWLYAERKFVFSRQLTWLFCRVVKKQRMLEFSKSRETLKTAVLWNVFCFIFSYAFRVTNAHFIREFYD